ncbi:hypothetical protein [Rubrivivax rivuli]|uniref:Uncharacterized protein n=1 Tax=Rubrivivax rivuli TaxID=1862385 RepID=A0A437RLJ7_9BURK|nr:hypothetical protein [Rubrivivax rivuli]RVU47668.1 hypothetical protein EOE66_08040 [Rubrivivax rivuli]
MPASPPSCPHCSQALNALAQHLKQPHCGSASCRQRADEQQLQKRWQRVVALAAQQAAEEGVPVAGTAPEVVWLDPAPRTLVAVGDGLRERLAQAWRLAAAEDRRRRHGGEDSATALPAAASTLCALCGGYCCVQGAQHHAFIDAEVLERWQARHPGHTTEDAIAAYLAALPPEHLDGGCAFQTATGCHLPREHRADICNRYVCKPLDALGDKLAAAPETVTLVFSRRLRRFDRAGVLHRGVGTPLHGLPQPDDLPP